MLRSRHCQFKVELVNTKKHHPRNMHLSGYDLDTLSENVPDLKKYIFENQYGYKSLDFSDAEAVKALNQALLIHDYKLIYWDIPSQNLCPAVPGRADLIHILADLLRDQNNGVIPEGKQVQLLDIGTGASLIYPILANKIYGWKAVASDIDKQSISLAKNIAQFNNLPVKLRFQKNPQSIFSGVIEKNDYFAITCCNPPFYESLASAEKANSRKWKNLAKSPDKQFNFSGQKAELWCEGGEKAFITKMIQESIDFKSQVGIFTCLVSNKQNINSLEMLAKKQKADYELIKIQHGNKTMHLIAWKY